MARKDLLKGLMGAPEDEAKLTAVNEGPSPARPRYSKGAIGAVSQSIAELKSRALIEVTADRIDPGGLKDRLEEDPEGMASLRESLKTYGQQVPVLLRPDPQGEGRYQIVYGRRRVAALRTLGIPVKAMVRDLSDHDLVVAQGQENTARRDLTFIEKANFARQMRESGFDRKVICDALNIDKTVISRMLSVVDTIPVSMIEAIGPAPSAGRDRWLALAERLSAAGNDIRRTMIRKLTAQSEAPSDQRFEAALSALSAPKSEERPEPSLSTLIGGTEKPLATARKSGRKTTLTFDAKHTDGFEDWLIDNMTEIHRDWLKARGE
jgi:ParB family chromosome partitioning protein